MTLSTLYKLERWCRRFLPDNLDPHDTAVELLLRGEFEGREIGLTETRQRCYDVLRKENNRIRILKTFRPSGPSEPPREEKFDSSEVFSLLQKMSTVEKTIIWLHFWDHLGWEEISLQTGFSPQISKLTCQQVLKELRKKLSQ